MVDRSFTRQTRTQTGTSLEAPLPLSSFVSPSLGPTVLSFVSPPFGPTVSPPPGSLASPLLRLFVSPPPGLLLSPPSVSFGPSDSELRNYLVHGFTYGFTIGCLNLPVHFDINNLKSADEYAYIIDKKVANELLLGWVLGPYDAPPTCVNYRMSPLGVVPKKNPGEFRMIHHLSFPDGSSVNDFIPKEISSVQYATIQDAIDLMKDSPKHVYMAKVDVESAFQIIPISPADRPLLGFRWRGQYFMDAVLSMGCSSLCAIFECFSTALEWVATVKLGFTAMVHVIDDFLIMSDSEDKYKQDLMAFTNLRQYIASFAPRSVPL